MPQEPIKKVVKDFTKRLKACVQANGNHFITECDIESTFVKLCCKNAVVHVQFVTYSLLGVEIAAHCDYLFKIAPLQIYLLTY